MRFFLCCLLPSRSPRFPLFISFTTPLPFYLVLCSLPSPPFYLVNTSLLFTFVLLFYSTSLFYLVLSPVLNPLVSFNTFFFLLLISSLPPFSVHLFFLEPFTFFLHIFLHSLTSHLYNTLFIYSQFFPHLGFPFNITLITLFKSRSLHILPSPLSLSLSFSFYSLPFLLQWVISQSLSSSHLHQGLLITPFILFFSSFHHSVIYFV